MELLENRQVGVKRTVYDDGGGLADYVVADTKQSETMKAILTAAPYSGTPINKYRLLDDCYRASGGFETGEYIIPHPRESIEKYVRRKNMSYYINYVKPIIDAHVNPIFKVEPTRQGMSNTYSLFINDVDGNNTSLTRFMKKVAINAKLHGVQFIVMDMEQIDSNEIITESDIINRRLYPYLYSISPSQVSNWSTDKYGKINCISYCISTKEIDEDGNIKTIMEEWTWTNTSCRRIIDGVTTKFTNHLGMIPVIPVYGVINATDDLIPQSDLYGIARTSLALMNACSELRERNRQQAFSLLTYPIGDDDDYESGDEPISIGTADMLMYRASHSGRPEFITPPTDSSDMLMSEIQMMIREIYRQANMQFVTQEQVSNVSGLAKAYDNLQLYETINELVEGIQSVEKKLAKLFGFYMGENMDNFSAVYNHEFGVSDVASTLANATTTLALNICEGLNYETKRKVVRSMLNDVDPTVLDNVLKELESMPNRGEAVDTTNVSVVQPTGK